MPDAKPPAPPPRSRPTALAQRYSQHPAQMTGLPATLAMEIYAHSQEVDIVRDRTSAAAVVSLLAAVLAAGTAFIHPSLLTTCSGIAAALALAASSLPALINANSYEELVQRARRALAESGQLQWLLDETFQATLAERLGELQPFARSYLQRHQRPLGMDLPAMLFTPLVVKHRHADRLTGLDCLLPALLLWRSAAQRPRGAEAAPRGDWSSNAGWFLLLGLLLTAQLVGGSALVTAAAIGWALAALYALGQAVLGTASLRMLAAREAMLELLAIEPPAKSE